MSPSWARRAGVWGRRGTSVPPGGSTWVKRGVSNAYRPRAPSSSSRRWPCARECATKDCGEPCAPTTCLGGQEGALRWDGVPRFKGESDLGVTTSKARIAPPQLLILLQESFTRLGRIVFARRPAKNLQITVLCRDL